MRQINIILAADKLHRSHPGQRCISCRLPHGLA